MGQPKSCEASSAGSSSAGLVAFIIGRVNGESDLSSVSVGWKSGGSPRVSGLRWVD
jgi:hypothetical protein